MRELLEELAERIGDVETLALIDDAGSQLECVGSMEGRDLSAMGVDLLEQLRSLEEERHALASGSVERVLVRTNLNTIVLASVSDSRYLLLVLGRDGVAARARFQLLRAQRELEIALA